MARKPVDELYEVASDKSPVSEEDLESAFLFRVKRRLGWRDASRVFHACLRELKDRNLIRVDANGYLTVEPYSATLSPVADFPVGTRTLVPVPRLEWPRFRRQ